MSVSYLILGKKSFDTCYSPQCKVVLTAYESAYVHMYWQFVGCCLATKSLPLNNAQSGMGGGDIVGVAFGYKG